MQQRQRIKQQLRKTRKPFAISLKWSKDTILESDEELLKKLSRFKKSSNISRILALVFIELGILSAQVIGIGSAIENNNLLDDLSVLKTDSGYVILVEEEKEMLYANYKSGVISEIEYQNELNKINRSSLLVDYARNVDDEKIQERIEDFDKKNQVKQGLAIPLIGGAVGTFVAGVVSAGMHLSYDNKEEKYKNEAKKRGLIKDNELEK